MTLLPLPLVRQSYDYSCGAASLASVLYYWDVWDGREPELYLTLGTCNDGTPGHKIIQVAESYGLNVKYENNIGVDRLRVLAEEGNTVILNIQAWGDNYSHDMDWLEVWEDGHYVVLVGVLEDQVLMMDPSLAGRYGTLSIKEFEDRWHDWSDNGVDKEYHTAIIIKGSEPANSLVPAPIY